MGKQDITYIRFLCFYDEQRKQTRDMIVSKFVASITGTTRYIIIICIYTIYVCIFKSAFVKYVTIPQNYSEISSDTIAVLFFEDEYPLMYLFEKNHKKQGYNNHFSLTISRQCFPLSFFQCFLELYCKRWEKN